MKKICVVLTIVMMTCAGILVQAQERELLRANIPFSFSVANTVLPAGSYSVFLLNPFNTVRIQSADGQHLAVIQGMSAKSLSEAQLSQLIFRRIQGEYFLAQLREQGSDVQRRLPLGVRARELAKNRNAQQIATAIPAR